MDLKRISSGIIVGIIVAIMLLIPNNYIIGILLTIIAILAMKEYLGAISKICKPIKWVAYLSTIVIAIINFIPEEYLLICIMSFMPLTILLLFLNIIVTDMKITFKDMAYTLLGICYITIFMTFLSLIDGMEYGKFLIGYIIIASFGTDIFAYVFGSKFGKHKFSKISPKKSIEGCIGGTISAIIISIIYTYIINKYLKFEYSYIIVTFSTLILSIISQIGDFSASTIKRYVDIKDYSDLIPGHGGMLDRIDSLLFISPFAYLLFNII